MNYGRPIFERFLCGLFLHKIQQIRFCYQITMRLQLEFLVSLFTTAAACNTIDN